jgi:hypothetical protein
LAPRWLADVQDVIVENVQRLLRRARMLVMRMKNRGASFPVDVDRLHVGEQIAE